MEPLTMELVAGIITAHMAKHASQRPISKPMKRMIKAMDQKVNGKKKTSDRTWVIRNIERRSKGSESR